MGALCGSPRWLSKLINSHRGKDHSNATCVNPTDVFPPLQKCNHSVTEYLVC